jgi:hypothetical protein
MAEGLNLVETANCPGVDVSVITTTPLQLAALDNLFHR